MLHRNKFKKLKLKTLKKNVVSETCIGSINYSLIKIRKKN